MGVIVKAALAFSVYPRDVGLDLKVMRTVPCQRKPLFLPEVASLKASCPRQGFQVFFILEGHYLGRGPWEALSVSARAQRGDQN